MASTHEIKVQWNSHHTKLPEMFNRFLDEGKLTDCSISVEGTSLEVHRIVLAACSPYFKALFDAHPSSQHPIIIMRDFRLSDIKALIQYMYKGAVQITRDDLREFQKTSQALKIKGLADEEPDEEPDGRDNSHSRTNRVYPTQSRAVVPPTRAQFAQPARSYGQPPQGPPHRQSPKLQPKRNARAANPTPPKKMRSTQPSQTTRSSPANPALPSTTFHAVPVSQASNARQTQPEDKAQDGGQEVKVKEEVLDPPTEEPQEQIGESEEDVGSDDDPE